jgi:hypothetical protein
MSSEETVLLPPAMAYLYFLIGALCAVLSSLPAVIDLLLVLWKQMCDDNTDTCRGCNQPAMMSG